MRMLRLPVSFVKFSIRSKQSLLLMVAGVIVTALIWIAPSFISRRSSAHGVESAKTNQQGCCSGQPAVPRRMIGTYYTTEDGFQSTLVLNNKGPNQIMVTPILHSQTGQTFTASPVAVGGQSSSEVGLNLLASIAGLQFRSGSFEFTYEGRMLEMGGGLRIVNTEKSLIFDEQMLEPGMKFPSPQLEAVYAVPFEDTQASVIVTNTTAQPILVNGDAIFAGANGHHPIQGWLGPYQTRVVNLPRGLVKKASAGAVSLNHNGDKGALLALVHLQDVDRDYSEAVNFTSPGGKTTERHGAGLRFGRVDNDPLRPVIAVRNIGESATTVTATVPYSKQNGDTGTVALPQVSLAPGAIKLLDASNPQLKRNDFATAGLEIKYTGAPGSVIASALSVSRSGNHVFALPMKDPQVGLSSTGGYPWGIDGLSSTVVFIKNTTNESRSFILDLVYPGGRWGSNLKTLAPGQTFKLDVREVRDSQMKGSDGNTVPLDTVAGHVSWSVHGKGANIMPLIGRAQTVDVSAGLVSTYECQTPCCPSAFFDSRMIPGFVSGFPGGQTQFLAEERDQDCFGNVTSWFGVSPINWSSSDPNVATCNPGGLATAINPGFTNIRATWLAHGQATVFDGCSILDMREVAAEAVCDVEPPCAFPVNFRQTGVTDLGGGILRFNYAWDSSTGNLADLSQCVVGEIVTYPVSGSPYLWATPPYALGASSPNPTILEVNASIGNSPDTHSPEGFRTPYTFNTFTATQFYRYKCPCKNGGAYVNLQGPIQITRTVQNTPAPAWTYLIQKSGSQASRTLP